MEANQLIVDLLIPSGLCNVERMPTLFGILIMPQSALRIQVFSLKLHVIQRVCTLRNMVYESISPSELSARFSRGEKVNLIDVRELLEYEICKIEGARLLPLSQFNDWISQLNPDEEIIVMCHHGIRSANLCMFLIRNGFKYVYNLDGGIDLWSEEVDANVPRY